jgi:hypothetical protein
MDLRPGTALGLLGLEMHTRRRNRANGTVVAGGDGGGGAVVVQVQQSFGNCPKYIQARRIELDPAPRAPPPAAAQGGRELGEAQLALVGGADTFFLATSSGPSLPTAAGAAPSSPAAAGCDVSHRGGPPGFVVASRAGGGSRASVLSWADYAGNNMFNSLGNLAAHPACGLLFVDFLSGDTLQVTGEARVAFEERTLPGAQRTLHFVVHAWRHVARALPILPAPVLEASPYNPRPAAGQPAAAAAAAVQVTCVSVRDEARGIKTFEFEAPPALRRAGHRAGQYASFTLRLPPPPPGGSGGAASGGSEEEVTRTWTISSPPAFTRRTGNFTISVKRAGRASGLLHDGLRPGGRLALSGVGGEFVVDGASGRPLLLVAGGIGAQQRSCDD